MSGFGVKNVLPRDIVTQEIFSDKSEEIVDYLNITNPQFCYANIDTDMLAKRRHLYMGDFTPIEIKACMKQHLIVTKPNSELSDDAGDNAEEEFEEKKYERYLHYIFDFVEIPSCVTLISGRSIEPLYFVLFKEKGIAEELLRNGFDHVINIGDMFLRGNFFKLVRYRKCSMKQF